MKRSIPPVIISALVIILKNLNLKCLDEKEVGVWCMFKGFLNDNKANIIIVSLLVFVIWNYYVSIKERNNKRDIIRGFLGRYFTQHLNGDKKNHRITVFEIRYGIVLFFGYLWHTLIRFRYYYDCSKLKTRLARTPLPWVRYLSVLTRHGIPNEDYRVTVFKIHSSDAKPNSFAVYIHNLRQTEWVKLDNINTIDLKKISNLNQLSASDKSRVKKYMNKSKIQKFSALKILGRTPVHLGGIPLFGKDPQTTSHIIMYDSNKTAFSQVKDSLVFFSKYIEIALKN
ncbi:hypothetical protein ACFSQJ_18000 [Croceitalea marina]|uniref:Uncharacterized protein n=1 Tax=Croceitalea marina TaxID=1775166 RepID=A0ABW5N244_9FLAO